MHYPAAIVKKKLKKRDVQLVNSVENYRVWGRGMVKLRKEPIKKT